MRISLTIKLAAALGFAGLLLLLFFSLWLVPRGRHDFLGRTSDVIRESGDAMRAAAIADVEQSREILTSLIAHTSEQRARRLEDLPVEIYANDLERFRAAILEADAQRRPRLESNVGVLAKEMEARARAQIDVRVAALEARQERASRDFEAGLRSTTWIALLATVASLLFVLGFALYRSVLAPIGRLRQATERVAGGDLSELPSIASADEVGQLSADFAVMVEKLRASQKLQEEKIASLETLAGGVAHEFNNLIGGIGGTAGQALAEDADEELRRESLVIIRRAAARGAELTAQLKRYSRAARAVMQPTDVVRVLTDAVALLKTQAEARGVRFEVDVPARAELAADGDGLHQVFLNLLRNGVQAMPDGGVIEVSLALDEACCTIRIRDHGVGIPEEVVGRIFDPFFTTKLDAVDAFERGSGLGLSVSHGVVKAHGASLDVDSEVGVGTTFTIRLPVESGAASAAPDLRESREERA